MNFKTALSSTGELIFIYKCGKTRKTEFIEVSYYGDDYLLAKTQRDVYYTLLDLEGDKLEKDYKIVYRFFNGLLLAHSTHQKVIESSDKLTYRINYNIYGVLNFDTDSISPINVFHSEDASEIIAQEKSFQTTEPVVIRNFLDKPLIQFKEFIFSEIIWERYILCCNLAQQKNAAALQFDAVKNKKIWEVADTFNVDNHLDIIDTNNIVTGKTLKETEIKIVQLIKLQTKPSNDSFKVNNDSKLFTWTKNDWWKSTIAKFLGSKS